jgi:hypothetical protein
VGFVVDEVDLRRVFSEYLGLPCQFSFHRLLHIFISAGAGTIGPLLADVPIGLSFTPQHAVKKIKNKKMICLVKETAHLREQ